MKNKILSLLKSQNTYISGENMSKTLGISRSAVWKYINKLRSEGYAIESATNKGYKLCDNQDILNINELSENLKTTLLGNKIYCYDKTDSTNNEAKQHSHYQEGSLFIADSQIEGRGRLGRVWTSPKGVGIWMSLLLKPNIPIQNVSQLTLVAGLSVCKAIENICKVDAKIKWPNDIVVGSKKVCGILTEMSAEIDMLNYVVCGIGVNVNNTSFDTEISSKATSLLIETHQKQNRTHLVQEILRQMEKYYFLFVQNGISSIIDQYKSNCITLNREVQIVRNSSIIIASAIDINENGELLVEHDGKTMCVNSGEVSVRGIYGYI